MKLPALPAAGEQVAVDTGPLTTVADSTTSPDSTMTSNNASAGIQAIAFVLVTTLYQIVRGCGFHY